MAEYDIMLHIDQNDPVFMQMAIRNATNYFNALPDQKFEFDIVVNGGGVQLLKLENKALHALAVPVLQRGVRLKACANALAEAKLTTADIWSECIVVPAGLVEITRLQKTGFAYVKP